MKGGRLRQTAMFFLAFALLIAAWEFYKAVGPQRGGSVFGWRIIPRADDSSMPHVWEMVRRLGRPELRGATRTIGSVVLSASWYSFRLAFAGLAIGAAVGFLLAVVMARFRVVERGLLPYVVLSQTVPLIALAPLVVSWGGRLHVGSFTWQRWMSASVISAFLAFFPISVGALRGLKSPAPASLELMDSYAASWTQTLFKLRFPASVPYLIPALRLAASSALVGTIVAEISTGLKGGIGRLVLEYKREATSDPAKVFTALFGAIGAGLVLAAVVGFVDVWAMRNRPRAGAT